MIGLSILFAFDLIGLMLHRLGVPLPANVLGMILFTFTLFLGWVRVEWVEDAAAFLLRHLMLFFVPTIVAVVAMGDLLRTQWLAITAGMLASLFASMLVAGIVAKVMIKEVDQ
jgi:holin-like protein